MQITHWNPQPLHTIRYRYARSGGGATAVGTLAVTTGVASGLPAGLGGLVLTADLQGRELIAPKPHYTAPHPLLGREVVELDGLRVGGVGGIIGHSDKWQRKTELEFRTALAGVLAEQPDLIVLHGGPDVPEFGCLGHPAIREVLLDHPPTLVVCG